MNPIINKKNFEEVTTNLRDLAYSYLEKYSPSKQQLKIYLMKKYLLKFSGSSTKKEITRLINEIIDNLEKKSHGDFIEDYQELVKLNNFIEKKFQQESRTISKNTKNKIDAIISNGKKTKKNIKKS